jgi:hypothetical protein
MSLTESIIRQIEDLGYAVSTHRMPGYVEMHAVPMSGEGELKLARCGDGDDDDSCYRCAVELARMVGIGLEGRNQKGRAGCEGWPGYRARQI